jgi:xanthine dehydrogenase YagR molybdenum-binding subunit
MLDTTVERLDIRDRMVTVPDDPSTTLPLSRVAARMGDYTIIGKGGRAPNPTDSTVNTFGAQFVEVEVDTETGKVQIIRVVGGHDTGLVINPLGAISQCDGGVIQAAGFALSEGRIMDQPTGYMLNANLLDYKMLTMLDIPAIDVQPVKTADPVSNNLGSKGLGEPPIIPTAAAIANAVYDAIGVRIRTLPLTPRAILGALQPTPTSGR